MASPHDFAFEFQTPTLDLLADPERHAVTAPLSVAVGPEAAAVFQSQLKLETLGDFLTYWPTRWVERGDYRDIDACMDGEVVTTGFTVTSKHLRDHPRSPRLKILMVHGTTDHGRPLQFNLWQGWAANGQIFKGQHYLVSGVLDTFRGSRTLKKVEYDQDGELLDRPVRTVYPGRAKAPPVWIEKQNKPVLDATEHLDDHLPSDILATRGLQTYDQAVRNMHLPETIEDAVWAKHRLAYDEAFATQLALASRRLGAAAAVSRPYAHVRGGYRDQFDQALPYELTEGQKEAGAKIEAALAQSSPMNYLCLGDVGSGKTLVASRALLQVTDRGGQGVMLAPTEVLAEQHYKGLREDLEPLGVRIALHSGSMARQDQKQVMAGLAAGDIDIVVGTHAVLSPQVTFKQLGLVVVDEQHRFGVAQRDALRHRSEISPHILAMTATPIPRTVAMTVFGDLDVVELNGVPAGRKPITSDVIPADDKGMWDKTWAAIRSQTKRGRQVFMVAALIDDVDTVEIHAGETARLDYTWASAVEVDCKKVKAGWDVRMDEHSVLWVRAPEDARTNSSQTVTVTTTVYDGDGAEPREETTPVKVKVVKPPEEGTEEAIPRPAPLTVYELAELARQNAPEARVGVLHGKMHPDMKNEVMAQFSAGELDILVSTTVIEVGVNVPNAVIMAIWDADRFGAAQLHQLRGRVGRGQYPGLCLLVTSAPEEHPSRERLAAVASTTNGYEIAEMDLEQRREGDILGAGQSGKSRMKLLDLTAAKKLIGQARTDAEQIVREDPMLRQHPQLAAWLATMLTDEEMEAITRA